MNSRMESGEPGDAAADIVALALALVSRYVGRHGHRLVQADGRLDEVVVSVGEARRLLGGPFGTHTASTVIAEKLLGPTRETDLLEATERLHESPALGMLAGRFGLDRDSLVLLAAAAAPGLSIDVARLYAFAWADFSIRVPTAGFLAELAADEPSDVLRLAAAFEDQRTLVRQALVVTSAHPSWGEPTPPLHRAVRVPPAVLSLLAEHSMPLSGSAFLDPAGDPGQLLVDPAVVARVGAAVQWALGDGSGWVCAAGARGVGRRSLVEAAARARGVGVIAIDLGRALLWGASPADLALELFRKARHEGALVLLRLDDVGADLDPRAALRAVYQAWLRIPVPIALTVPQGADPVVAAVPVPAVTVNIPLPDTYAQRRLWESAITRSGMDHAPDLVDTLQQRLDLTPGGIGAAVGSATREVRALTPAGQTPFLGFDDITRTLWVQSDAALGTLAERVVTTFEWSDIVLPPDIHETVQELLGQARNRDTVLSEWGFGRLLPYGGGLSCLFSGPPGTGKTMLASLVALSLGKELYRVDLSRVVSKWVGETETNLRHIFDESERGQVVLLFDEADSLFARRTEVRGSNDRFANMEVNYLLQRMESYGGVAILTTNLDTSIDEAFRRRLKFRIRFPFPSAADRERLWRSMLPPEAAREEDIAFHLLAERFELTGGSIKNACLRAAYHAAASGVRIAHHHLARAATAEAREMGILVREGEPGRSEGAVRGPSRP